MANGQKVNMFELARKRAKQQQTADTQKQKEALKRRFAQAGLVASGEAIKQEQLAERRGQQALAGRMEGIDVAEQQENLRKQEIQEGREFARGERMAGQQFAAEQAGLGRKFQAEQAGLTRQQQKDLLSAQQKFARGERLSSQEFAALEASKGREFSAEQAEAQRRLIRSESDEQRMFQERMNRNAQRIQQSQFKEQMDLAIKQYNLDEKISQFNMANSGGGGNNWFSNLGDFGTNMWKGITGGNVGIGGGGGGGGNFFSDLIA